MHAVSTAPVGSELVVVGMAEGVFGGMVTLAASAIPLCSALALGVALVPALGVALAPALGVALVLLALGLCSPGWRSDLYWD